MCDEVLGERGSKQHRFDWLLGDPNAAGRAVRLPVDAYYARHQLVVEYQERQHDEPVPFMDHRDTVSGVARGVQRRIYDERRERLIPSRGLRLVVIRATNLDCDGRGRLRRRDRVGDLAAVRQLLGVS